MKKAKSRSKRPPRKQAEMAVGDCPSQCEAPSDREDQLPDASLIGGSMLDSSEVPPQTHSTGSIPERRAGLIRAAFRSVWELRIGLAAMLISVFATHACFFKDGFAQTSGDPSDAALIAYLIERDYRWVVGAEHGSFWDPPMFYPHRNTAAYTDTLLGGLPLYAPFRVLGADPQTAFQLWLLAVGCLNYFSLYVLLRKLLHYGEIASNSGAFLFAFGSGRLMQEWHPQLVPEFYVVASLAHR